MSSPAAVLTFAVIGEGDSPIFEADLAAPPSAAFADATVGDGENGDDDNGAAKDPSSSSSTLTGAAATDQPAPPPSASSRDERAAYLHQFILHAALDAVDEVLSSNASSSSSNAAGGAAGSSSAALAGAGGQPHLGVVDRFNALQVSAYVTPGSLRLLLLHDGRPDDVVRGFFKEVHEALVKARLNPFFIGGSGGGGASNDSSSSSALCCGGGSSGTGLTGLLAARGSGFDRRVRSLARSYFRVMV